MRQTWQTELIIRELNVKSRAGQTIGYYARKRQRRIEAEDSPEFLLSPGRIRGYDVAARTVIKHTLVVHGSMRCTADNSPKV